MKTGKDDWRSRARVVPTTWAGLLSLALTLTLAVELDKWRSRRGKL